MKFGRLVLLTVALLALPIAAHAQTAFNSTLSGTVKDNTGAVLPGVTVTATDEAQGTKFVGVTDDKGAYRVAVRPGTFRITADLSGFTTVTRPGIELLLGRQVVLNLDMTVSGVQESVTVTGEAPLLDTTSSNIAGNIDPRQMQDLPNVGRNWMDLTMLAPGSRANTASEVPQDRQGFFQVQLDGQSVTLTVCCSQNQPSYSKDTIAEFQLESNRFDATQGRTMGMMVNAVTKSGTNVTSGTLGSYFRNAKWNAADPVAKRVLPYKDSQVSGTIGGPIVKDKLHYFANWEYERNPDTVTYFNPSYPRFNMDLSNNKKVTKGGAKVDWQLSPKSRMSGRWSHYVNLIPESVAGGATNHPSTSGANNRYVDQYFLDQTQVISNNSVNEIKGGLNGNYYTLEPIAGWGMTGNRRTPGTASIFVDVFSGREITGGTPRLTFSGYTFGSPGNNPQRTGEHNYQLRDDFTTAYNLGGRHDVKMGGDFIKYTMSQGWCNNCDGNFTSTQRPPANIEQLIPVWNDASTWNFAALSPLIRDYQVAIGNMAWTVHRQIYAAWYQDDWKMSNKLTANLGVRYDLDHGAQGEWIKYEPWLSGKRPTDKNNVAPRLGFAYAMNDKTVIRGGWGLFFTELEDDALHQGTAVTQQITLTIPNNGRADFAANPYGGPTPTYAQALATACDVNHNAPGCIKRSVQNGSEIPFGAHDTSYSHMASIGIQRQLRLAMAFESNFVFTGGRQEERRENVNLTYNPATGANYPSSDVAHNPFPEWGPVAAEIMLGRSNYRGWESTFTKRFSNHWQANANYSLSTFKDDGGIGGPTGPYAIVLHPGDAIPTQLVPLGFPVARDLAPMYQLTATDQRHRATFNGIWDIGKGVQMSGLYFFGSGERRSTTCGGDLRNTLGAAFSLLCADGTVLQDRASFVGKPIHRVDMRLQKRLSLGGKRTIDGQLEMFNVFNHANYGSYTTVKSNAAFGQPNSNTNTAYQPRVLQLGVRFAF